jgi:light-harvesting protein B-800-850 alpha chain
VGLPLFLGSVAATSLIVHYSILSHTTFMSSYWGGSKARVAEASGPAVATVTPPAGASAFTITVAPGAGTDKAASSFVITVTPNAEATKTASADETADRSPGTLALAAPPVK